MSKKLLYLSVLIPVLLIALALQIYKVEPFESFSLSFNDVNFKLQNKTPNPDIVFVAVDEPSVNEFGRWPFDRDVLAKGISKLYEADTVLMDMIFSEFTSKKQDEALAKSLSQLNSSVCGFFLRKKSTQNLTNEDLDVLGDSSLDLLQSQIAEYTNPSFIHASAAEINILPISRACTLNGSFTTLRQNDKLLRSYPVAVYFENILYPSLAIQGLRVKFNTDIERNGEAEVKLNKQLIKLDEQGFVRLNFYKKESYTIVSFLDVVKQKIKPEFFKNKIVILGITEVGAGDIVSTPIGSIPGPLLHYTFISNFLENHLIFEPKYISNLPIDSCTYSLKFSI